MKTLEERLAQVEARLEQMERLLPGVPTTPRAAPAVAAVAADQCQPAARRGRRSVTLGRPGDGAQKPDRQRRGYGGAVDRGVPPSGQQPDHHQRTPDQ